MMVSKDFRKVARDGLKGRWPVAVAAGVIASMLGGDVTGMGNITNTVTAKLETELDQWAAGIAADPSITTIVGGLLGATTVMLVLYGIFCMVVGGAASMGYAKFNLNLVNNNNPEIKDIFSEFKRFKAGFVMYFLRSLYTFLWMLLLIVPGIIASYSYAMAPYILMENPDMTASEAIKASKELMQGNKWRLFCMQFSFIGWDILCGFTMGIGYLLLNPYRSAATAAFYREIKWEKYKRDFDAQNVDVVL